MMENDAAALHDGETHVLKSREGRENRLFGAGVQTGRHQPVKPMILLA
jgi:hypothetical protein